MTYKRDSLWEQHPESVTDLIDAWSRGESLSAIARDLSRRYKMPITRNAVIGKVRRLELEYRRYTRRTTQYAIRTKKTKSETVSERRAKQTPVAKPPTLKDKLHTQRLVLTEIDMSAASASAEMDERSVPASQRVPILKTDDRGRVHANDDLSESSCRWPIGDPRLPEFGFCGLMAHPGARYCQVHLSRNQQQAPVYRAPTPQTIHPTRACATVADDFDG